MKKVVFHTLGCKTNQYDSEAMLERLLDGGYELAREPEQISLKDVLAAVEGPYQFSRCLSDDYVCTSGEDADCKAHKIFCEITNIVQQRLSEATFDQLV